MIMELAREVSIVGDVEAADTRALLDVCATAHRPHQILALVGLRPFRYWRGAVWPMGRPWPAYASI
jgi:hypothetical protein